MFWLQQTKLAMYMRGVDPFARAHTQVVNVLCLLLQISLGTLPQQPGYKNIPFLHSKGSHERIKSVTHLVVTDLSHARGRSLALAALEYLLHSDFDNADDGRIGLILEPQGDASALDAAVQLLCEVCTASKDWSCGSFAVYGFCTGGVLVMTSSITLA